MDYEKLAMELFEIFDSGKKGPPHEEMSASLRGEMAVMRLLCREETQLSAGEISRRLNMTTPRVAAVLGSLEKKGLLCRTDDEHDKRRVICVITEKGRALHQQKKERVIADIRYLLEKLGDHNAAEFVRLMHLVKAIDPPSCCGGGCDQETKDSTDSCSKTGGIE